MFYKNHAILLSLVYKHVIFANNLKLSTIAYYWRIMFIAQPSEWYIEIANLSTVVNTQQ